MTKDCHLYENRNRKAQVFYSSGDQYDEDCRKPKKELLPYYEYKKQKEEKYKQKARGFYKKEESVLENKKDFETMLALFIVASERGMMKPMHQ